MATAMISFNVEVQRKHWCTSPNSPVKRTCREPSSLNASRPAPQAAYLRRQVPAMHIPLLRTLIVTVMMTSFAVAAPLPPPPKAERFISLKVEQLAKHVSTPAWRAVQELLRKRHCPQDGTAGHHSRKPSSKVVVVTVECYPPQRLAKSDDRYYAYLEYPLTVIILGDRVTEVDPGAHGFMYESGRISFITDIDGNNNPEFWLAGPVCECDGEPEDYGPEGCDCDGGVTVEFRDGRLQPWKKGKGWNRP